MTRNFIIIEPDAIVAMDLESLLAEHYPAASIVIGASLADVGSTIYKCGPDCTLLVRGLRISKDNDLRRIVQEAANRGTRVITIGEQADVGVDAKVIEVPFTTEMVLEAVAHVDAGPDQRQRM